MRTIRVADLAHGRSGDKGDTCNVGLIAYDGPSFAVLRSEVTAERVKQHFGGLVAGPVTRYELPNIRALNFVLTKALDGGGTMSLRSDHLGKVMYAWLLRMELAVAEPGELTGPDELAGPGELAQPREASAG